MLNTKHIKVSKDIRPKKFAAPFAGPYQITHKSGNVYTLALPEGSKVYNRFHVSLLRPYVQRPDLHKTDDRPPPVEYNTNLYTVKKLLSHKKVGTSMKYLVHWEGYPESEST